MAAIHNILLGMAGAFNYSETISTNTPHYQLRPKLIAAGWDGVRPVVADLTVLNNVVVGGANTAGVSGKYHQPAINVYGLWAQPLYSYHVWDGSPGYGSINMVWNFYFPFSGDYTFQLAIDDYGTLYVDEVAIVGNSNWGAASSVVRYVTEGWKTIRINAVDTGGQAGAGANIRAPNGSLVWSTRDLISPGGYGNSWIYKAGFEIINNGVAFPPGSKVTLNNYGTIVGHGGMGGRGQNDGTATPAQSGFPGGNGLLIYGINTIVNNYGTIAGGGGGGAGGPSSVTYDSKGTRYSAPGGGGGGGRGGLLSSSYGGAGLYTSGQILASPGTSGTFSAAGSGGNDAGSGGGWGQAGGNNSNLTAAGGNAGAAIIGTNYITWGPTGTRLGSLLTL